MHSTIARCSCEHRLGALRTADRIEAREPDDAAEREEDPTRPLEVQQSRHREMEVLVGLEERRRLRAHLRLVVDETAEVRDVLLGCLLREAPDDERLDQGTELVCLLPLCLRDRPEPEPALGDDLDQPLALELDQRFPDGRTRDAQRIRELHLGVEAVRGDRAGSDRRPDRRIRLTGERLGAQDRGDRQRGGARSHRLARWGNTAYVPVGLIIALLPGVWVACYMRSRRALLRRAW